MTNRFKYDLTTVYGEVSRLAKEYKKEGLTESQKNFIITDILEVSEELVLNMCQKFMKRRAVTELSIDELYAIAISEPLLDVLNWHDFNQKGEFMVNWISFMEKRFCNALKEKRSKGANWFKSNVYSSDKPLNDEGTTIVDLVGQEDFAEETCSNISILEMVEAFEKVDKHGEIIRCLLIKKQNERTEAFLNVLGADEYEKKERKAVERVKARFIKFLIKNKYDLSGYDLTKYLK